MGVKRDLTGLAHAQGYPGVALTNPVRDKTGLVNWEVLRSVHFFSFPANMHDCKNNERWALLYHFLSTYFLVIFALLPLLIYISECALHYHLCCTLLH